MTQKQVNYIFSATILVLALVLGYFGVTLPLQPEIPTPLPPQDLSGYVTYEELALVQRNIEALQTLPDMGATRFTVSGDDSYSTSCYQMQGGSEWVADSGCTWALLSGATLEAQAGATIDLAGGLSSSVGAVTVTDSMVVTDNLSITNLFLPGFANETISDGEILTPTKTVYALDSAGAVTLTLAASASEGQLLFLIGDDNNNVTVADTNVRTSTGNALVIGQYDVAAFVYQDAEWIQLLLLANQ